MPGAEGPDIVTSSLVTLGWALCGKGVRRQPQGSLPTAHLVALWLGELWGREAVRRQGGERAAEKGCEAAGHRALCDPLKGSLFRDGNSKQQAHFAWRTCRDRTGGSGTVRSPCTVPSFSAAPVRGTSLRRLPSLWPRAFEVGPCWDGGEIPQRAQDGLGGGGA